MRGFCTVEIWIDYLRKQGWRLTAHRSFWNTMRFFSGEILWSLCGVLIFIVYNGHKMSSDCWSFSG